MLFIFVNVLVYVLCIGLLFYTAFFVFSLLIYFNYKSGLDWSCCGFSSLYLLITSNVLHKSRFSRLTSDFDSLFQLNGFSILSLIELCNIVNTVKGKEAKSKETG